MAKTVQYGGPHDWTPMEVKVIFRKWPDGEVLALFPEMPYDAAGWSCFSYSRIGQHGAANCGRVMSHTRAATPEEYQSLLRELGQVGYARLKIMQRMTPGMLKARHTNTLPPI